jgi:hypothetical protein
MWGLANHLRTYNVALDLARSLGRELVIVNHRDFKFFSTDLQALVSIEPHADDDGFQDTNDVRFATVEQANALRDCIVLEHNTEADCKLDKSLVDYQALDHYSNILVHCCGLTVPGLVGVDTFYRSLRPSPRIMELAGPVLRRFDEARDRNKEVVGVHIRQGSIEDYHTGLFFGAWPNDGKHPPTLCCFEDHTKNVSSCAPSSSGIERFVRAMHAHTNDTVFFVCTDRPGCVLFLEQEFPGRLVYSASALRVESDVDLFGAFCDFHCLAQCDRLILSEVSSFSREAARYGGNLSFELA